VALTAPNSPLNNDISILFRAAKLGKVEISTVPRRAGDTYLADTDAVQISETADPRKQWFFGIALRGPAKEILGCTLVWLDIDDPENAVDPKSLVPTPTIGVASGKGHHIYWALSGQVTIERAVQLSTLAAIAFGGDQQVLSAKRVMRLPGSWNRKYDPPKQSAVEYRNEPIAYEAEDLETRLVAAVLRAAYMEGEGHAQALAAGAVLARAGWDEERVGACIDLTTFDLTSGLAKDRRGAAVGSVTRYRNGETVSATALHDALGDNWKRFNDALGVLEKDGDLVYNGTPVGKLGYIERDMVHLIQGQKEWAFDQGTLVQWTGTCWHNSTKKQLKTYVFDMLSDLHVVDNGVDMEFIPTSKLAAAISDILEGSAEAQELGVPELNCLPLLNGTMHLSTMEFTAHDRSTKHRYVLPIEYDPTATAPLWQAYLAEAVPAYVDYLQEWAGYCLSSGNPWQRFLWLYGPSGTGKSVFIKVLAELLGETAAAISLDGFMTYTVASLASAKVAVVTELSDRTLHTPILKQLVSSDPIIARHPYGRPFTVRYTGKLVLASNVQPQLDQVEGMFRRIDFVPFDTPPKEEDQLLATNITHTELSGIFNWALAGYERVRLYTKWDAPLNPTGENIAKDYEKFVDPWIQFFEEEIELGDQFEVTTAELYKRYSTWAADLGYTPKSRGPEFYREMRKHGLVSVETPKRISGRLVRYWVGGRLYPFDVSAWQGVDI
jgi:putative DNA primase/helicase